MVRTYLFVVLASVVTMLGCTPTQEIQSPQPTQSTISTPPQQPLPIANTPSDRQSAQVISVGDGDTFRAKVGNEELTVRLACIDAPETDQPQGRQSSERLRSLLPRDAVIVWRVVDTDRYGRTVAEVYLNNSLINTEMLQEGRAIIYPDYLDGCASNRDRYLAAEARAKDQRLAFWSQADPIMPWDWRQGVRPVVSPSPSPVSTPIVRATPSPVPTQATGANCDSSYPGVCIPPAPPDLDCGDISFRRFAVEGSDPHRFDGDHDGVGCES